MASILMINVPYAGHTNPTLPLAALLVQRGHTVCYINAEEFRGKIEQTGAEFIPYSNYPASPTQQQIKKHCFRAAFDTALGLKRSFDVLIYEMLFYPGKRIAELLNIPCVRQFSQPAWNEATMLDATRFFRLSCFLIDAQLMGKKKAKQMGLAHTTLGEAVVYDKPDLNIVYVPKLFQNKSETFGDEYIFTLPSSTGAGIPAAQEIPYEQMKSPIVYISLGSMISSKRFCKKCIRAFGGKQMSVILNTGKIRPESLGELPSNIYAYSFVPQLEVLDHADVFLTHCGMNSASEAMVRAVPMVVMPFINDQIANAKRLVELGIGKRVRPFVSSANELYKAVCAVYEDKQMKSHSQKIQESLKKEATLENAVQRIEKLLQ